MTPDELRRAIARDTPAWSAPASSHGVTPEPPAGSEHYREGWRDGYAQHELDVQTEALALRAELQKWHAVGRRIVEAHRQGWTPILQSDADELARLTGEAL